MTFTNYKSFYGSREVRFTKGFTLIQGANGSGKSNILDGFSFVLGGRDERTDKVLEVITRRAGKYLTNSAEVKITFDNSDRKIPFDKDEVTVLRQIRLTPKGSHYSIYKLNDETTSLTEISESLTKAGVTAEGYNIIKQGKIVERATEDPVSRRQLLESIAGTAKFDADINEIEARILSIDDKLKQLELYLGDSYRILEGLEKEKNRTLEFEELDKRLRKKKVLRFGHIRRHHENDHEKLNKTIEELEMKKETLSKKIEKYSESIQILQTQKEALESEERRIEKNKAKTAGIIEGFNSELNRLKNESKLLDLRISQIKTKTEQLYSEIEALNEEKEKLHKRFEKKTAQKKDSDAQLDSLTEKANELEGMYDTARKENETLVQSQLEIKKKKDDLNYSIKILQNEIGNLAKIIDEKTRQKKKNSKTLNNKKLELEKSKQEIITLEEHFDNETKELKQISKKIDPLNQEVENIQIEIATIQAKYNELKEERNTLQKLIKEGKIKYDKAVESVLEARNSGQVQGVLGTLIELIESVDTQFVDIIESAIGPDKLQALVVEDENLTDIIEYLHRENISRVVLFPLRNLNGNERNQSIPEEAKDYQKIKDLVTFKPGYEHLKENVFGDILIIEDLHTALRFSDFGAVTLKKDLILNGAIFSGNMDSRFLTTKYNKEKLKKLKQELSEIETKLEETKNKLHTKKKTFNDLDNKKSTLQGNLGSRKGKISTLAKIQNQILHEIDILNEELETMDKEVEIIKKEDDEKDVELKNAENNLEMIEEAAQVIEEEIRKTQFQELKESLENIRKEILNMERSILKSEKEIAKIENKQENTKMMKETKELQIKDNSEKVNAAKNDQNQLSEKIKEVKEQILKHEEEISLLEDERLALKTKLNILVDQIKNEDKTEEKLVSERIELDKKLYQLRVDDEKTQQEINRIDEEIKKLNVKVPEDDIQTLEDVLKTIEELEKQIGKLGPVDPNAIEKYNMEAKRRKDLFQEKKQVEKEKKEIIKSLEEIQNQRKILFLNTFNKINKHFGEVFKVLHGGGSAKLILLNKKDPLAGGVNIEVDVGAGKISKLIQLSGGEKSATVIALILAIQAYEPAPLYLLDEIDMHLDDVHSENLGKLLAGYSENAQYLVITPRNEYLRTHADRVYSLWKEKGVTNVVCRKIADYDFLDIPA